MLNNTGYQKLRGSWGVPLGHGPHTCGSDKNWHPVGPLKMIRSEYPASPNHQQHRVSGMKSCGEFKEHNLSEKIHLQYTLKGRLNMWNEWNIVKYMCFLVIQLPPAIHHIPPAIHPLIGVICPSLSASSSASCCLSRSKAARSNSRSASRSASRSSSFSARKFPGGEATSSCRRC